jgi:hypothetical protein
MIVRESEFARDPSPQRVTDPGVLKVRGAEMRRLPSTALLAFSLLALSPLATALDEWSSRGGSSTVEPLRPLAPVLKKQPPSRPRRTFSASEFVFVDPPPEPQRGLRSLPQRVSSRLSLRSSSRTPKQEVKFRQKLATVAQAAAGTALIVAFERSIWAIGWYIGVKIPSAPVCPRVQSTTVA